MRSSVPFPGPGSKYAIEREPNHVKHARALMTAMWGFAAAVGRLTGISERILQFWMSPHGEKEGPFEKGARILRALRELGAPDWQVPLVAVADEFGFDLTPRPDAEPTTPEAALTRMVAEFGDIARELEAANADGHRSPEEKAAIRAEIGQLLKRIGEFEASLETKS